MRLTATGRRRLGGGSSFSKMARKRRVAEAHAVSRLFNAVLFSLENGNLRCVRIGFCEQFFFGLFRFAIGLLSPFGPFLLFKTEPNIRIPLRLIICLSSLKFSDGDQNLVPIGPVAKGIHDANMSSLKF